MIPVIMDVASDAAIAGRGLPLIVISHGNGGAIPGHADLALALASAGYVVAAPMHNGDNYADQSAVGSASFFAGRTRQLRATVDYMLNDWPGSGRIDPQRIGAFGFSMGGFTVLTAVGVHPDLRAIASHCAEAPEFACDVLRHFKSPYLDADVPNAATVIAPDQRIKAAVVAAPGFGFTLDPQGLAGVHVPIQLWSAEQDDKVPYATNSKPVRESLGARAEFHSVAGAGHLSFGTPCGLLKLPGLCTDPPQFDRPAFHRTMNASVVAFFGKHLKHP